VNAGPDVNICPAGQNVNFNAVYTGPPPPNQCNVYAVSSIPFAPVAGVGTAVALSDDQVSAALPIGFTFQFFCNNYTQFYISSNGFLGFDAGTPSGCCGGQLLPNASTPNNVIAAAWDDLYPPGAGSVNYQTIGAPPNRKLVVNWTNIPYCCGATPAVTTQIIMYETTNVIEIHNTSINAISPGTQGIENSTGAAAYVVAGRNSAAWSATNDAYRFTPQVGALIWTWNPPTYLNATNINNPTATGVAGTITYTVSVNNGTCTVSDQVTVTICLPVENVTLSAEKAGENVGLTWTSFNEVQLHNYVIERNVEGQGWTEIGRQQPEGGIGLSSSYSATDFFPGNGLNLYRLRLENEDGSVEYSNQDEVIFGTGEYVSVSPNPGKGLFDFEIGMVEGHDVSLEIFNVEGKQVFNSPTFEAHEGINILHVDIQNLSEGPYYYFLYGGISPHSGRLIIGK
jgi:hypothetical protein